MATNQITPQKPPPGAAKDSATPGCTPIAPQGEAPPPVGAGFKPAHNYQRHAALYKKETTMKSTTRQALEQVLESLTDLDDSEYIELLEDITAAIKQKRASKAKNKSISLLDLQGLGKEIWKDVDVEQYLNEERNSWK